MPQKKSTFEPDSSFEAMEESIPKTVLKQYPSQPILRIGFMEGYEKIDFRVSGEFNITDLKGDPIFSKVSSHLKWRSLLDGAHGATFIYSVLVTACREESAKPLKSNSSTARRERTIFRLDGVIS